MKKYHQDIKNLYKKLKDKKIPKTSKDPELSDWIDELLDIDAYLAGLACSTSEGEQILLSDIPSLEKLTIRMGQISPSVDPQTYYQCKDYLNLLIEIKECLEKLAGREKGKSCR